MPYSFLRAGIANEHTGDHTGAERAYRRGLGSRPTTPSSRNALGWTLFQDGRTKEAVAGVRAGARPRIPSTPRRTTTWRWRWSSSASSTRRPTHFSASLAIEPKAEIYSDLGFALAQTGPHRRKRSRTTSKALAARSELRVGAPQPGRGLRAGGRPGGAPSPTIARRSPGRATAETHNGLGYVLARQGRADEAIAEFRKAITADPKFTPAYNNLAEALARQGKLEDAAGLLPDARWPQRPNPAVHNALGGILRQLGRADEAEGAVQQG